ncbi:hypothetical protein FRC09_016562 [Ceratobasidium sp. 395]|nr:hypothetical protein FRC09_016562 [Ceratobasidium sp. 395]
MAPSTGFQLEPLPTGVTIAQVYKDYMQYLYKHTWTFFQDRRIKGQEIWNSLAPSMEIIMAHPNGWGIREQGVLRTAAVAAGLTTAARSNYQITFVSEAEASVQFCLSSSGTLNTLANYMNLVICDAGGSTVDTTVYKVTRTQPLLELKEIKASACVQAGGIFVDHAAESYLRQRFASAGLSDDDVDDYTKAALVEFVDLTKPNFGSADDTFNTLNIKRRRLNLPSIQVRGGYMKLTQ